MIGLIVAEIWIFILVGQQTGAVPVVLAVLASMAAGVIVIRRQGLKTLSGLRAVMEGTPLPKGAPLGSVLVYLAGILLIVPGFLSDVAAIALLLPPVRQLIGTRMAGRWSFETAHFRHPRHDRAPYIDGEAVDITTPSPSDRKSPWRG